MSCEEDMEVGAECSGEKRGAGQVSPVSPSVVNSAGQISSGVKKHQHKHNLKHRYELLETLGRGTYGKVKKAIERHSGRVVSNVFLLLPVISLV